VVVLDGVVPPEQLRKIQEELQLLVRPFGWRMFHMV
jgi:hypothetical protein